jgi:hypothetical protein
VLGPLGGCMLTPEGFATFLQGRGLLINQQNCTDNIDTQSQNFTVRVTANVGDVSRTTTFVVRSASTTEEYYFYSVR